MYVHSLVDKALPSTCVCRLVQPRLDLAFCIIT